MTMRVFFLSFRFCGDKYEPLQVRHVMLRTNAGYNRPHLPIMYDVLFVRQYFFFFFRARMHLSLRLIVPP
jgi:hypothetical protein